jgi:hypothetical protein
MQTVLRGKLKKGIEKGDWIIVINQVLGSSWMILVEETWQSIGGKRIFHGPVGV